MAVLIFALFFICGPTRRLVVALAPFFIFGISYDWMNIVPNYMVNPVDVQGLYETEKSLFGIATGAGTLTPNEFFAIHHCAAADFAAGIFYLCWVPLPIVFGLWLYFTGKTGQYLHFAMVFLLVNLLGFTFYYIHPAAPPWYVALHGFEAVPGTPGDVAGLGRFDEMTGLGIFNGLYARNSNVFAAASLAPLGLYARGAHLRYPQPLVGGMDSPARPRFGRNMVDRRLQLPPLYHRRALRHSLRPRRIRPLRIRADEDRPLRTIRRKIHPLHSWITRRTTKYAPTYSTTTIFAHSHPHSTATPNS